METKRTLALSTPVPNATAATTTSTSSAMSAVSARSRPRRACPRGRPRRASRAPRVHWPAPRRPAAWRHRRCPASAPRRPARAAPRPCVPRGEQLDREADVRSILGLAQAKPSWDLLAHGRCSSRWVRKHHRTPELLDDGAQTQVVGAEVVAPLGYAVRLVHHGQGRSRGANALEHVLLAELLGRHEHGFKLASRRSSSDSSRSPRATVEESCAASVAASRSTSDSTWSRCSAASGETTSTGPSMSSPAIS